MRRAVSSSLGRDRRGIAAVEFGLLAPVFLLLLMGGFEIGYTMFIRALLVGQLQKAARDMSLEGASATAQQAAIENSIRSVILKLNNKATVNVTESAYHDYANVQSKGEPYTDTDGDGTCDHGESFTDYNNNGVRDADSGTGDRGGAIDVVLMTATVSYPRLPMGRFFTADPTTQLTASTLLRNQPSASQYQPATRTCT